MIWTKESVPLWYTNRELLRIEDGNVQRGLRPTNWANRPLVHQVFDLNIIDKVGHQRLQIKQLKLGLQNVTNLFIVSLAVADLCVAGVVMPLYAYTMVCDNDDYDGDDDDDDGDALFRFLN